MAKIGYARVSSLDQNLDRQLELLSQCDKIFTDKASVSFLFLNDKKFNF